MQKSVIIFGGSLGIGRGVADFFVSRGYGVTVAARGEGSVKEAEGELSLRGMARGFVVDVSTYSDIKGVVDSHLKYFGCLDCVINAAALQGPIGLLWDNDPDSWRETILVNLVGSFNICRAILPVMRKIGGTIVLFSGGGSAYARPHFSAYGASKTGVLRLVETVDAEIRESDETGVGCKIKGIKIYAVAPGAVKTRMTNEVVADRTSAGWRAYEKAVKTEEDGGTSPEKVAELCLFLAEESPACLSGRLIHVNEPYREYVRDFEGKEMGDRGLLRREKLRIGNKEYRVRNRCFE
ncbi:MAG: SDR family oxidoreductase [Deltaproteobacteria bacterium]|nr:SDR family oxidoreductase [Deltaproteobacteria bacterium]